MRTNHTITGPASLKRALWLRRGTRITLALPTFSVVQQENLELRFNRRLADSGNEFSTLALIASLVGCILFDAAHWAFFAIHPVTMLAANLFVSVAAALFGKTLGILRARWQLARLIWSVAERLEDVEENASPLAFPSTPRGDLFALHSRSSSSLDRMSSF